LVAGHVFLGQDGVDRALGDAHRAVDALVGVDGQEVRALAEAIDRADIDAVGVLAADARFGTTWVMAELVVGGERAWRRPPGF
jgi:hypothetical protein